MDVPGEKPQVPAVGVLVAATFALMTTWADPQVKDEGVLHAQRNLIARKIVSNLALLKADPQVSPELCRVLSRAQDRWITLLRGDRSCCLPDPETGLAVPVFGSILIH